MSRALVRGSDPSGRSLHSRRGCGGETMGVLDESRGWAATLAKAERAAEDLGHHPEETTAAEALRLPVVTTTCEQI